MEIIKLYSNHKLILSESNDNNSDTLDGKFVICDFDPNKNDVMINRERIDEWIGTLQIKPLVGKVVTKRGVADFTGHNVKVVKKKDADGNEYQDIEFDTSAFGSFYSSTIETIDEKEHIVANAKIWKRFSQAYEVIKRRIDSEKGIKTSWEIQVLESHYETINGKQIKVIDKGVFIGHALLGETVEGAYDSSGLLEVASAEEADNELAEALALDMQHTSNNSNEEDSLMGKTTETSALTVRDLHQKVREALNPKGWNSNPYYSVWEIYPEEHKILAYDIDRSSDDEYFVFTYSVENDTVTIGEKNEAKLSSLIAEKEVVKQLVSEKESLATELSQKNDALVTANEQVRELNEQIEQLAPFKTQYEEAQRIEQERVTAEKKAELKLVATKSGLISDNELETSEEIKNLIEALDEKGIKAVIAERFLKTLDDSKGKGANGFESAESKKKFKTNINNGEDGISNYEGVMSSFLKNN